MHILDVLKERGFIAQTTFEDELYSSSKNRPPSTSASIRPLIPSTSGITSRLWRWRTCSARDIVRLR